MKERNTGQSSGDDSVYHSSNDGASEESEEEKRKNEEDLEDVFVMNEIQIHEMLAEAVANKGEADEELNDQLDMNSKPVEMTDK